MKECCLPGSSALEQEKYHIQKIMVFKMISLQRNYGGNKKQRAGKARLPSPVNIERFAPFACGVSFLNGV